MIRSTGRLLYELDGRPAAEVYLERHGLAGADLGREEFEALAVTHPLAQPELNGSSRLRHVLGWEPQISLEEGLARTYKWVEAQVERKLASGVSTPETLQSAPFP